MDRYIAVNFKIPYLNFDFQDVNDVTPTFSQASYSATAAEDVTTGTSVLQVSASDADTGAGGTLSFIISGGDGSGIFSVSSTGVISTVASLDYETKNSYNLLLTVVDGGTPQLSSQCIVIVQVTDINDNTPVFSVGNINAYVTENLPSGTSVAQVKWHCANTDFLLDAN